MKSKVSIQKSFIYAVTVVAILAVVVGVVLRFTSVSADTPASSNADAVSDCYRDGSMKGWYSTTQCSEKMAVACTRTKSLATKTAATPTDQEKATFGEKVKAWNIVINKANPQGKFRLVMGAKRTSTVTVSRIDFGLTPLGRNWGGNGDRIYLIFGDGMGYKKVYNYIALNTTWTSYINRTGLTGDVDVMFVGKNEDGCLEGVLDLPTALVTPTPSPSPSPSASIPPLDPNLVDGLRGCYYNGKSFDAYIGPRTENVNFIWGRGPAVVNGSFDHFSVRWEGMVVPKYTETYKFKVNYDDAVRLWIGGKQYINDWNNNTTTQTKEASVTLQAGVPVSLRLEYFENTSDASVQLYWSSSGQKEQIIPVADLKHDKNYQCAAGTVTATPVPSPSPTPSVTVSVLASITPNLVDGLQGCYYNGKSFDTYLKTRSENIQFNWGIGTPFNTVIDKDNFSARWEGVVVPKYTETYFFKVDYNDAARLWIDGRQYVNDWADHATQQSKEAQITLQADVPVPIKVEYYEGTDIADIHLYWKSQSQPVEAVPVSSLKHDKNLQCAPGLDTPTPSPSPPPTTTLGLDLNVSPAQSSPGESVELNAISSTNKPSGSYFYYFWWNCDKPVVDDYNTMKYACGDPSNPFIGSVVLDQPASAISFKASHIYSTVGTFYPKALVIHAGITKAASATMEVVKPTLTAGLIINPTTAEGAAKPATLTASAGGTATGSVNYTFWWNCNVAGTNIADLTNSCGSPYDSSKGAKYTENSNQKIVTHDYIQAGTFYPKVVVERGSADPQEARSRIAINEVPIPTLNVSLGAVRTSPDNTLPAKVDILANISGSAAGQTVYKIWWDCQPNTQDYSKLESICGNPTDATKGTVLTATENEITANTSTSYALAGLRHPFVLAERQEIQAVANTEIDIPEVIIPDTLTADLTLTPSSINKGDSTTLRATTQSNNTKDSYNYYFWWNCPDTDSLVLNDLIATCGDPADPDIGKKFLNLPSSSTSKEISRQYGQSDVSDYTISEVGGQAIPRVFVEHGTVSANSSKELAITDSASSPTPVPSPSPSPTATPSPSVTPIPSPSPTPGPSATPRPTQTPIIGQGIEVDFYYSRTFIGGGGITTLAGYQDLISGKLTDFRGNTDSPVFDIYLSTDGGSVYKRIEHDFDPLPGAVIESLPSPVKEVARSRSTDELVFLKGTHCVAIPDEIAEDLPGAKILVYVADNRHYVSTPNTPGVLYIYTGGQDLGDSFVFDSNANYSSYAGPNDSGDVMDFTDADKLRACGDDDDDGDDDDISPTPLPTPTINPPGGYRPPTTVKTLLPFFVLGTLLATILGYLLTILSALPWLSRILSGLFNLFSAPIWSASGLPASLGGIIPAVGWPGGRHAWGVIYDSSNKHPIEKALVRVFSEPGGKLRASVRTNAAGQFGFIMPAGTYSLTISQTGYDFPTRLIVGQTDGRYANLYKGGNFKVDGDGIEKAQINFNVPVDRVEVSTFDLVELRVISNISRFFQIIRFPLMILGTLSTAYLLFTEHKILHYILAALYVLMWAWEISNMLKKRAYGLVRDQHGKPVPLVMIRVLDKYNRLKTTVVSGEDGKFQANLDPGEYRLDISRPGYKSVRTELVKITSIADIGRLDLSLTKL